MLEIYSLFPNICIEISKVLIHIIKTAQNIEHYKIRLLTEFIPTAQYKISL